MRRLVRQMSESGLRIIRLFLFWDYVEPFEAVWDFARFDSCFEQAERSGMQVVPTLTAVSPPGYMRISTGPQNVGDLDDPVFWDKAMEYVRRTVRRYRNSPALHSWILWNEPSRYIRKTEHSIRALRRYLRSYYQEDIEAVNRLYYNRFQSFDEIGETRNAQAEPLSFRSYAEMSDWLRFCRHNLCEKLADIGREVRRWDDHPIHVNPHDVGRNIAAGGQSVWREAREVDFIGCSCHPAWHSVRFERKRLHQSVSMFADLMRSATDHPDGLFWVTELQGGNNLFSGSRPMSPDRDELARWIWMGLGCGAEKVLFWCFNMRNEGFEGAEWGLLGLDGTPSPRLCEVGEICKILDREQDLFSRLRPPRPQVYILHGEANWILSDMEGEGLEQENPRNRMLASDAVSGAYQMCQDLGLQTGFVNEERVLEGKLPDGAVLLAPSVFACPDGVCEALERFVAGGGTLIADQMFALKDEYGRIRYDRLERLERLFGVRQKDLGVLRDGQDWKLDGRTCRAWFMRMEGQSECGEILGRFSDGAPAVIRRIHGPGMAVRIQTVFFQRYFFKAEEPSLDCLRRLLPEKVWDVPCRLENPSAVLSAKLLSDGLDQVLMLFNSADAAQRAVVRLPEETEIRWLSEKPRTERGGDGRLGVMIPAGKTAAAHIRLKHT